jgi:uncharacterized membrane protein
MAWLGQFHPQIIHAPIVLLIFAALFDLVGRFVDSAWWRKASLAMLVIAVAAGVCGILSGEQASEVAEERQGIPEEMVDGHGDLAKIAIWVAGGALAARLVEVGVAPMRSVVGVVALLLELASAVTIGVAAHRGGQLVYRHGAAVRIDGQLLGHPKPEAPADSGEAHER